MPFIEYRLYMTQPLSSKYPNIFRIKVKMQFKALAIAVNQVNSLRRDGHHDEREMHPSSENIIFFHF